MVDLKEKDYLIYNWFQFCEEVYESDKFRYVQLKIFQKLGYERSIKNEKRQFSQLSSKIVLSSKN
jgi:hypothetical protein